MVVFMRQLGLSPSESATIVGVSWCVAAVFQPIFGFIADKLEKHKQIMISCLIVSSILFACLLCVPASNHDTERITRDKRRLFCGIDNIFTVNCGEQNCTTVYEIKKIKTNAANVSRFICEGMVPTTCVQGIGPSSVLQCLDVTKSASSFGISTHVGNHQLPHMETGLIYCQYEEVISVNNSANSTLFDVHCSGNTTFTCYQQCALVGDKVLLSMTPKESKKFAITFWLFGFIYIISNIVSCPVYNLLDALTYSHLGEERTKWGPQRTWGAIGYPLFGAVAGYVMDTVRGKTGDITYAWCFALFFLHHLLATFSVYCYKTHGAVKCSNPIQKLYQLLKNPEVLSLYLLTLLLGMLMGIIETFRFWHLQNLGASQLLLGLSLIMGCIPEIVVMFVMTYIIKLLGEHICLYLACVAFACRFMGYSFLRNPWFVMLVEPLHGLTFGVMYGAATAYGSRLTPEGMHGTMQAMLTTLHISCGK